MSSFTSPLIVSPMANGRNWRLVRAFTYRVGKQYSRRFIRVPAKFETDFASIPKLVFWVLPWWAKFNKSSVLHDWLYKEQKIMGKFITRLEADRIWLEAMHIEFRHHHSGKFYAMLEYVLVRMFGFMAWQ